MGRRAVRVGVKLFLHALHESGVAVPEISIGVSLAVILGVLTVTTISSLIATKCQERAELTSARG
ncbi:hypothetical protein APR12_004217 [Nocardia amikacinitolerans]|nr:hypothetical protein [Nocardia amikacinitolerans]